MNPACGTVPSGDTTVAMELADSLTGIQASQIPRPMFDLTKQIVLDYLGVSIAASTLSPEAKGLSGALDVFGHSGSCTVLGFNSRTSAAGAAFVNGGLGHLLDFDDAVWRGHPSIVTVPVALALAEDLGTVSGEEFLTAVALGVEVLARLGRAPRRFDWPMANGWEGTQLLGYLAAAATAGRLLGLQPIQMAHALGLAFGQLSGSREMAATGSTDARGLQGAFASQGGLVAAQLAKAGLTGPTRFIEGRFGLFANYLNVEDPDLELITGGFGARFIAIEDHSFKVWPTCAENKSPVAAALELLRRHNLSPDDIESVTVWGDAHLGTLSEPTDAKRHPKRSIDAKYSMPFTVATAMVQGTITLDSYAGANLGDREVAAMADRVRFTPDIEISSDGRHHPLVEIATRDGTTFRHRVDSCPGDPQLPLTRPEVESKFLDCVAFSHSPIPINARKCAVRAVDELDTAVDATELIRTLYPAPERLSVD